MDGNLASIYTLIHAFLTKHSHTKAAQAVKKAAKEVVILKDDIDIEGPQLDEIIAQWKLLKATLCSSSRKASAGESSTSESDSDSSTSSESRSSSSSSSNRQTKKVKAKGTKKKASSSSSSPSSSEESESGSSGSNSSESDSSESDSSSDSDSKKPIKAPVVQVQIKANTPVPLAKSTSSKSSSSSSNSSSESDDETSDPESSEQIENVDKEVKLNTDNRPNVERYSSRTLSSENTSSSSLGSNDGNDKGSLISLKRESSASTDPISKAGTPKAQVEQVQVTKKRRTDRDGTAVATATTSTVRQEETRPMSTGRIKGTKPGRQANERFRRVDPSKMEPIADNRYVAKVAPTNDYGQRAHEDLIVTRGQGFRKEKNKKKKGSYRGGEITMESHSFKFA